MNLINNAVPKNAASLSIYDNRPNPTVATIRVIYPIIIEFFLPILYKKLPVSGANIKTAN